MSWRPPTGHRVVKDGRKLVVCGRAAAVHDEQRHPEKKFFLRFFFRNTVVHMASARARECQTILAQFAHDFGLVQERIEETGEKRKRADVKKVQAHIMKLHNIVNKLKTTTVSTTWTRSNATCRIS